MSLITVTTAGEVNWSIHVYVWERGSEVVGYKDDSKDPQKILISYNITVNCCFEIFLVVSISTALYSKFCTV